MTIYRSLRIFKRMRSDQRGAFMPIFAVCILILIAMGGASVDLLNVQQAKTEAQIALDAATLALQADIFTKSEATIEAEAQALLREQLDIAAGGASSSTGVSASISKVDISTTEGRLALEAKLDVSMFFVTLIGIPSMQVKVSSEAVHMSGGPVEVALVLDNSGVMDATKLAELKKATKCAVDVLFFDIANCGDTTTGLVPSSDVKISLVPYADIVNIGTQYKTATWMDTTGISPVSWQNFDNDADDSTLFKGPLNRFAIYDQITNADWEGCVEARPYPLNTNDAAAVKNMPETLYVPYFAPDEPDSGDSVNVFDKSYIPDNPTVCSGGNCNCTKWTGGRDTGPGIYCQYSPPKPGVYTQGSKEYCTCPGGYVYQFYTDGSGTQTRAYCEGTGQPTANYTGPRPPSAATLSKRELQERVCKYTSSASKEATRADRKQVLAPSRNCPAVAVQPLSKDPNAIVAKVNAMSAWGMSNIHQGVVWGYRTLTPADPFTGGAQMKGDTQKIMILMVGDKNRYTAKANMNKSDTEAYAYYYNHYNPSAAKLYRLTNKAPAYLSKNVTTSDLANIEMEGEEFMNALTLETCANARNDGIRIHAIALNPPDDDNNPSTQPKLITMLQQCTGSSAQVYTSTSASELADIFKSIASQSSGQSSELRLTH